MDDPVNLDDPLGLMGRWKDVSPGEKEEFGRQIREWGDGMIMYKDNPHPFQTPFEFFLDSILGKDKYPSKDGEEGEKGGGEASDGLDAKSTNYSMLLFG